MSPNQQLKKLFLLDPQIIFLNFGSYGACPMPVFKDYQEWQQLLEFEPVNFIATNGPGNMKRSRQALAEYIGCHADNLVYTPNPTFAINIVAKNLNLKEGDEILSTNLEYGAMDRTWNYYCSKHGAKYIMQPIRFPIETKEEFIDQFWKGYSQNTKVIFLSHITSATALILPVKEICSEAKKRGLITIVDGAHVPGHIPLNIDELDVDFYTGACHKWMMTPKGSSFLYASEKWQSQLEPLIISWGYESDHPSNSQFLDYHQFNGTRDFSAYLSIPRAIQFMNEHNWEQVSAACKNLVLENALRFCELSGQPAICKLSPEFIGQMFSIPVRISNPEKLYQSLFHKHHIQIPVTKRGQEFFVRYSINAFNSQADLDHLFRALSEELAT